MSESERFVYFDMDNTMFDFDAGALSNVPEEYHVPRSSFYVADDYPEYRDIIQETYNHPYFFDKLPLMPGVVETWSALYDAGYHPVVLSSPLSSNPRSVEGKRESLRQTLVPHFGQSVIDEAIFDKNKWKYRGAVLFEDRPDIPRGPDGTDVDPWTQVLFGWKDMKVVPLATTTFRLLDWTEPAKTVAMVDEIVAKRSDFRY